MKRFPIYMIFGLAALIGLTTVTGLQAQVAAQGLKSFRKLSTTTSATGKVQRDLQQFWRAGGATRGAALVLGFRYEPRVVPPFANVLDTLSNKRTQRGDFNVRPDNNHKFPTITTRPKAKPLHKIKSNRDILDETLAGIYDTLKVKVNRGERFRNPHFLFELADYALRHNDEEFAIICLENVQYDRISPDYWGKLPEYYNALIPYMPDILRGATMAAYELMLICKLEGVYPGSALMQAGDTLLAVTDKFNPALNPLVKLSYCSTPSNEIGLYMEVADSVIASCEQWTPEFLDVFAGNFISALFPNGDYTTVLDYFEDKPFKGISERNIDIAIDLAECAFWSDNDSLYTVYFKQAEELDPVFAENFEYSLRTTYWNKYYSKNWNKYLSDPTQLELADWLILSVAHEEETPAATTSLVLAVAVAELMEGIGEGDRESWDWDDISNYTPQEADYRNAILHILDKGLGSDNGQSDEGVIIWCRYLRALALINDSATLGEGKAELASLAQTGNPEINCPVIFWQAYIAAHGLDKPKEGLKILTKNITLLDEPRVNAALRQDWYDYMAALATRLGKTKEANKYLGLKESITVE